MLSYLVGLQMGLTFADLGLILPQLCDQTTQNIHNMLWHVHIYKNLLLCCSEYVIFNGFSGLMVNYYDGCDRERFGGKAVEGDLLGFYFELKFPFTFTFLLQHTRDQLRKKYCCLLNKLT